MKRAPKFSSNYNRVDIRSDTVTKPTQRMRRAMLEAPVGDDVLKEDISATQLEDMVADMWGKEAGLLVPSGTMGNLIAQMVHANGYLAPEVVVGDHAHTLLSEVGGAPVVGRVQPRAVTTDEDGTLPLDGVELAVRHRNIHHPETALVILENTHNFKGGRVLPLQYLTEARALCDKLSVLLHADGARMWNAATALNVSPIDLGSYFDTISLCLSKSLGAPAGTVIVGNTNFIEQCRRVRKMLGGGMRQVGVLAAAGITAIDEVFPKLPNDHQHAHRFAEAINSSDDYQVLHPIESNIVYFAHRTADDPKLDGVPTPGALPSSPAHQDICQQWEKEGNVFVSYFGGKVFRAVFHHQISTQDVDHASSVITHLIPKTNT